MKIAKLMVSALLLVLLLVSCIPKAVPAPAPQAPAPVPASAPALSPIQVATPAKPAWEVEWEKTVQAAKKEGTLVLITTAATGTNRPLSEAFKSRFGIGVEWMAGSGTELGVRLLNERRAGIHSVDAATIGVSVPVTMLKPAGAVEPLEPALVLPELTDPKEIQRVWRFGKLEWVDKDHTSLVYALFEIEPAVINTDLVKPGEIKSFRDLLNPKWKGGISMFDPTLPQGTAPFAQPVGAIMGWDYLRKLAGQQPVLIRDSRLQIEWVARGKYAITLANSRPEVVKEFVDLGAPVKSLFALEEGGILGSASHAITVIKDAPHPSAAKLFVNWLLSREAQTVNTKAFAVPSSRLDVSTEGLNPLVIPDPTRRYVRTSDEQALLARAEALKIIREIFGPLMK